MSKEKNRTAFIEIRIAPPMFVSEECLGTELSLRRSYAAGGGREEYGEECSSVLCSVFSSGLRMPACRRVTCMWQMPATRTAECNSGHTLQCRASVSNPSGWKCNACAAAEPSTSTRQAITSQGGIQRAMLPCLCFITNKPMTEFRSHLQHVSFARHGAVKNGVNKEAEKQPRHQSGHNHDGEGLLRV